MKQSTQVWFWLVQKLANQKQGLSERLASLLLSPFALAIAAILSMLLEDSEILDGFWGELVFAVGFGSLVVEEGKKRRDLVVEQWLSEMVGGNLY